MMILPSHIRLPSQFTGKERDAESTVSLHAAGSCFRSADGVQRRLRLARFIAADLRDVHLHHLGESLFREAALFA